MFLKAIPVTVDDSGNIKFTASLEAGKIAYTGATTGIATVSVGADAGTAVIVDDTAPVVNDTDAATVYGAPTLTVKIAEANIATSVGASAIDLTKFTVKKVNLSCTHMLRLQL